MTLYPQTVHVGNNGDGGNASYKSPGRTHDEPASFMGLMQEADWLRVMQDGTGRAGVGSQVSEVPGQPLYPFAVFPSL